jgi:UDP-4-amino-4,6-dideoxy-N-acetyl-beta-L-altrosamine transaminase
MIPYGRQNISEADIAAVVEVLHSDLLTQGPLVPLFEERVARHCGAVYGVAANSATSALHIACLALGVRPGDRVWTSPVTFLASANCARYCGATVDFVDIDPRTYNMSVPALAEKLDLAKRTGELPKIVIPVHLCGQSADMEGIGLLADKYGFKVIEDASHAIGATYKREPVGCCRYSDVTIFSFHPVKIITSGEGGMAMTNDPLLAKRMMKFRSHGVTTDPAEMHPQPETEIWNYQQLVLGYNYRMTDIHAALGISQLDRIQQFVEQRRKIANRYDELLSETPLIRPWQHPDSKSSYHLYPVRIPKSGSGVSQKSVFFAMRRAGVGVNLHYIPVYLQPYYASFGFGRGYCKEAELYFRESISLPIFPDLGEKQQERIVSLINDMLRGQI